MVVTDINDSDQTWSFLENLSPREMVCLLPLMVPPFCKMAPLSVTRSLWPGIRSGRTLFWGVFTRVALGSLGYELAQVCWSSGRLCCCNTCWEEVEFPMLQPASFLQPHSIHISHSISPDNNTMISSLYNTDEHFSICHNGIVDILRQANWNLGHSLNTCGQGPRGVQGETAHRHHVPK